MNENINRFYNRASTGRIYPTALQHFHLSFMCKFVASMDTPRGQQEKVAAALSLRLVITLDL